MKTLEQLKSLIDDVEHYWHQAGYYQHLGDKDMLSATLIHANKVSNEAYTSLATIHALAAMKAQELRRELAGLVALKQGDKNEWEWERARNAELSNAGYDTMPLTYISPAGLARIQEIKRLLGEGGEEG